jgi:hypothetical protein
MAKCEEGYRCDICGQPVEEILDSDLYLRYVLGWVDPETLHSTTERHIRCNPALAQYIDDPLFPPISVEGDFDKRQLDPPFVQERTRLVTRGWLRLREVVAQNVQSVTEYPLQEVLRNWSNEP